MQTRSLVDYRTKAFVDILLYNPYLLFQINFQPKKLSIFSKNKWTKHLFRVVSWYLKKNLGGNIIFKNQSTKLLRNYKMQKLKNLLNFWKNGIYFWYFQSTWLKYFKHIIYDKLVYRKIMPEVWKKIIIEA